MTKTNTKVILIIHPGIHWNFYNIGTTRYIITLKNRDSYEYIANFTKFVKFVNKEYKPAAGAVMKYDGYSIRFYIIG